MRRKIVSIDETKCDGCGLCIPNCHEEAIKLVDGKARLVADVYCDGLGACLGTCPKDAITIIEREAKAFNEAVVAEMLHKPEPIFSGCPGTRSMNLSTESKPDGNTACEISSRLTTWPVQLHLIPVSAPHFKGRNLLLAADCVAYAVGDFHRQFLKDSVLAIACPKLDEGQEIYLEKIKALITESGIASLTVLTMEVPCCSGLVKLVRDAMDQIQEAICQVEWKVISIKGEVLKTTVLQ
ncbi:MAG: 4Fe-4S ferredoxin [Spirochaetaceae bacterium]|nr:MAG: 4Fe-4S ferredoxin [Spirochaetaceae bacterium]